MEDRKSTTRSTAAAAARQLVAQGGPLDRPLLGGEFRFESEPAAAQQLLAAWSTLVLARLDAVLEQDADQLSHRDAVLEAVTAAARERGAHVRLLLPFLGHPALEAGWRRHCSYVSSAAGEDVSAELATCLASAVGTGDGAEDAAPARRWAGRCVVRTRRQLGLPGRRATGLRRAWRTS